MKDAHQILVYAENINLIDDDISGIERNAYELLNIDLAVKIGETICMEVGCLRGV